MAFLNFIKKLFLVVLLVGILVWVFVINWSFVFKKKIVGEVVAVQKVDTFAVITNSQQPINPQAFSFSVAIKDGSTNEIHMASSEDRKWAAVQKGNCVVAAFFPYPPWNLTKGSTDHNARLLRNYENCSMVASHQDSFWDKLKFFFLLD